MNRTLFEIIETNDMDSLNSQLRAAREREADRALLAGEEPGITPEFLARNANGETLLHVVVKRNSFRKLEALLNHDVPLLVADASGQVGPAKDNQGNTLLHAAVVAGHFGMVQELIARDYPMSTSNQAQRTALQLAESIEGSEPHRLMAALMRTRTSWQNEATGFRFNRVVYLIKHAFPSVEPASGKDKVLLLGRTGAGKSTLLNYMNGARYDLRVQADSRKRSAVCIENHDKVIAKEGMGMISQTLYPQVVAKPNLNYVYCDLAGLFDSRGDEERICAASSVQILSRLPGKIKGIAVVLDLPSFMPRGEAFKRTALALAEVIQRNPELMKSIYFVITHVEKEFLSTINGEAILRDYVRELLIFYRNKERTSPLDPEEGSLKFLLEGMVRGGASRIVIPNITDQGQSRQQLEQAFSNLTAQEPRLFNFINHDGSQECFNAVLTKIAHEYVVNFENRRDLPGKIAAKQRIQQEEQNKITHWRQEITRMEQEINQPYNAAMLDAEIAQKQQTITANDASIATKRAEIQAHSNTVMKDNAKLGPINTDEKILVKTIEENFGGRRPEYYRVIYPSPHPLGLISSSYSGCGSGNYTLEKPKITDNYGVDEDGSRVRYYEWDDDAEIGNYQGLFTYSKGLASIKVKIHTAKRHLHKAQISDLHREIANCNDEIRRLTAEVTRLEAQNVRLREEILSRQTQKIQGAANHEIRRIYLETAINERHNWINESNQVKNAASECEKQLTKKLQDIRWELQVNQDLFRVVFDVTHIIDYAADPVPCFRQLYQQEHPTYQSSYITSLQGVTESLGQNPHALFKPAAKPSSAPALSATPRP